METNDLTNGIEHSYSEHQDLLIFALTGRTGSGCSTAARLLADAFIRDENFAQDYTDPEYRKRKIIDDFCEKNWIPFSRVVVSSLLITYLIEVETPDLDILLDGGFPDLSVDKVNEIKAFFLGIRPVFDSLIKLIKLKRAEFYAYRWLESIGAKETIIRTLPQKLGEFRDLSGSDYNIFFQKIGNNIRLSGTANDDKVRTGKMFSLPERVAKIIEILREIDKSSGIQTRIVIDAIRNPFELMYLRDR